jgi:hypothetical protein
MLRNCLEQHKTHQQQEWGIECGVIASREVAGLHRLCCQETHLRIGLHHSGHRSHILAAVVVVSVDLTR